MRKIFPLLLLLLIAMNSWSQPPADKGGKLTANQAAAIAQQRHGGRILSINPKPGDSYQVRLLLSSGKVIQVKVGPEDKR